MSSTPARVADVVPFSWVDGPGTGSWCSPRAARSTALACHNPETIPPVRPGTRRAVGARRCSSRSALAEPYLAGVTVSGGEATGQWRFVRDLFTAIRSDHAARPADDVRRHQRARAPPVWDELIPVTDGFMVDLKALDPDRAPHGSPVAPTASCSTRSATSTAAGRLAEVRLLLVPGFNDSDDQLAPRPRPGCAGIDPHLRVVVIGFRPHGVRPAFADTPEAGPELLAHAGEVLTGSGLRHVVVV